MTMSTDQGSLASNLIMVSRLGLRPRAAKIITLISCDPDLSLSQSDLVDLTALLQETRATLHWLAPSKILKKDILGVKPDLLFLSPKEVMTALPILKDYLSTLALDSGGSVFSLTKLSGTDSVAQASRDLFSQEVRDCVVISGLCL